MQSRSSREAHLIAAKGESRDFKQHCRDYIEWYRKGVCSWNDYLFQWQCVWMVSWKGVGWVCTCLVGCKWGQRKYTLGMAIIKGDVDCLEEAKTVPIGRKGEQGRPRRVSGLLVRDDGQQGEGNRALEVL